MGVEILDELDLGLLPDIDETSKRANYFLRKKFQHYLNLSGLHRNQLTSPALSFAPGSTNKNGIEISTINEIVDDINIVEPNRNSVSAIYKSMVNCTQTPESPHRSILIGTYVDNLTVAQLAIKNNLAERTINKKKKLALCEFADRLEYWKRVFGVAWLPDLRVFEK